MMMMMMNMTLMVMMVAMTLMMMMMMVMMMTPQEGEYPHDQGQLLDLEKLHLHEQSQPGETRNHHQPLQGALKRLGCCYKGHCLMCEVSFVSCRPFRVFFLRPTTRRRTKPPQRTRPPGIHMLAVFLLMI